MNISPILIQVVIRLLIVGVILGLINRYVPMASGIKSLLNGVVLIYLLIWTLQAFAILGPIGGLRLA